MTKRAKSRKSRTIKQIDVLKSVRKQLPPPTIVFKDKRRKRVPLDEMGDWVGPGSFGD